MYSYNMVTEFFQYIRYSIFLKLSLCQISSCLNFKIIVMCARRKVTCIDSMFCLLRCSVGQRSSVRYICHKLKIVLKLAMASLINTNAFFFHH